jgi:hypothetical protein
MLEDQSESLKSLKTNLENKSREHQALLKEVENLEMRADTQELQAEVKV